MKRVFAVAVLLAGILRAGAASPAPAPGKPVSGPVPAIDTVLLHSPSMGIDKKSVVVVPSGYNMSTRRYPVVYMLNGYGGSHQSWLRSTKADLAGIADRYGFILVCVDGANSWYIDSPVHPKSLYDTYITKELIPYIDRSYRTVTDRSGRGVMGLSMGGHGALLLSIEHPDLFSAAGSMSGAVDIRTLFKRRITDILPSPEENYALWTRYSVLVQADRWKPGEVAILFDCGVDDYLIEENRELHQRLVFLKIPHEYTERPGKHNHPYWYNALDYQMLFFSKNLAENQPN